MAKLFMPSKLYNPVVFYKFVNEKVPVRIEQLSKISISELCMHTKPKPLHDPILLGFKNFLEQLAYAQHRDYI